MDIDSTYSTKNDRVKYTTRETSILVVFQISIVIRLTALSGNCGGGMMSKARWVVAGKP